MKNNQVNIYWSPFILENKDYNWEILYSSPISLYDEHIKNRTNNKANIFNCPAFNSFAKNVFIFKNTMDANFYIDENNNLTSKNINFISSRIFHPESIENRKMIEYGLSWIFFSEDEDIDITITAPFFDCPDHLNHCNIVPGKFSISNWFRAINAEFILKPGIKNLNIKADEPLMYVMFNTNKKVNLLRFEMTDKLLSSAKVCGNSTSWESWVPLISRYKRFKESKMRNIVLKHIKENIVKES